MKKYLVSIIILISMVTAFAFSGQELNKFNNSDSELIKDKMIRFHVIANSDSIEDQDIKLKVRDKVLEYIYPKLEGASEIDKSREILKENDKEIKDIALKVLQENNYDYKVESTLSNEMFPVKSYGDITLPQGEYEAYRIILGDGKGQNWWCVMFPPLCFVDITKGEVSSEDTEEIMKKNLSEKEYDIVKRKDKSNIIFKSKIGEVVKDIKTKQNKR
ncbi:stage II sporulation protein R [Clostridium algidicarnis]|uniref:Stage II sporulation protein R n=2 Tax=Clostridium algidicarnis TaxID=37659 RepID=A0A2S6FZ80_9CLOT|nr:stage II sporulation protein R [Clostridium algidicarnis]MBB6631015.1 stage II sporulation protein R [Clostridium algidicarnis]MBB6698192.1 stage II sporulation protein R [Clostridium algidicarnis]MBU3194233.1 stage II sporulation protein R [Clostridium algidicarnis]MBU3205945.1 stage II sporulation protein R [Clostridium algidicarnis]MBU3220165.1 stage II sporulation protein R [Clostridium algidicarnis]